MENYKEMYRELFIAVTKAIRILEEAQQKCEEIYINEENTEKIMDVITPLKEYETLALCKGGTLCPPVVQSTVTTVCSSGRGSSSNTISSGVRR